MFFIVSYPYWVSTELFYVWVIICFKHDWLIYFCIQSAIVDIGNSILKIWNGIKFQSLPVSILYAVFALFWLVLDSSLVNITDFMIWNIKDFLLTEL